MRRVIKHTDSELNKLKYKKNGHNSKIRDLLLKEQNHICAYTEMYLEVPDGKEIEHFNSKIKYTTEDGYHNWFMVKDGWNKKKGTKWYDEILHPTAEDFENRILYLDGDYILADENDIEAENLIKLLNLDNYALADRRKRYIRKLRKYIEDETYKGTPQEFIDSRMMRNPEDVFFIRAIESEFNVKVNFDLHP